MSTSTTGDTRNLSAWKVFYNAYALSLMRDVNRPVGFGDHPQSERAVPAQFVSSLAQRFPVAAL